MLINVDKTAGNTIDTYVDVGQPLAPIAVSDLLLLLLFIVHSIKTYLAKGLQM
jgi:hypothetical protein